MFLIFKDDAGGYRWHLTAENGEIVAQSEAYTRERDALRGVEDAVAAFVASVKPEINSEVEKS